MATTQVIAVLRSRRVMVGIVALCAFFIIIQQYFPTDPGGVIKDQLGLAVTLLTACVGFSGVLQLFLFHIPIIRLSLIGKRTGDWWVSYIILGMMLLTFVMVQTLGLEHLVVTKIFVGIQALIPVLMISSMAWMNFRCILRYTGARNADQVFFAIGCLSVIIMSTPLFKIFAPWLYDLGKWLRINIGTAPAHSVNLGVIIGTFLVGCRVILGRETGFLGRAAEG